MLEEPREVLRAAVADFREMTPNRQANYCCGGGSGLVALPEYEAVRLKAGKPKVRQIGATGAAWVAAACENCRLQLTDLAGHYRAGYRVTGLAELVVRAMCLPGASSVGAEKESATLAAA